MTHTQVLQAATALLLGIFTGWVYAECRKRIRRLRARQRHLEEMFATLARDVAILQQMQAQYTTYVASLRQPSPRRSHTAHQRALDQQEIEDAARQRTVKLDTMRIDM